MSTLSITDIRLDIRQPRPTSNRNEVAAYCSVLLGDAFVVRDIRLVHGPYGFIVSMPSRRNTDHCEECDAPNHLRANYCSRCGMPLDPYRSRQTRPDGSLDVRPLHSDLAFPANSEMRRDIEAAIIAAFEAEVARAHFVREATRCSA
jgi:DNA-binding cell septation regulator SpoVG